MKRTALLLLVTALSLSAFAADPKVFTGASKTAWMSPSSFHLTIGMKEAAARDAVRMWHPATGREKNHLVVTYDEGKTLTLVFDRGLLDSARFEFVGFHAAIREAFEEQHKLLAEEYGKGRLIRADSAVLIYDQRTPNIYVVLASDRKSRVGKQGIGYLTVRYFLPETSAKKK